MIEPTFTKNPGGKGRGGVGGSMWRALAFWVIVSPTLLGCQNDLAVSPPPPPLVYDRHAPLLGPLESAVQNHLNSPAAGSCDSGVSTQMLEIARALDERGDELMQATSLADRVVRIGPYTFIESEPVVVTPGWRQSTRGWTELIARFERLRRGSSLQDWVELDRDVRAILVDDANRLIYFVHPRLDRFSPDKLRALAGRLDVCANSATCIQPQVTSEDIAYIEQGLWHRFHWNAMQRESSAPAERRDAFLQLRSWVVRDLNIVSFRPNPRVRRTRRGLDLPLDLGQMRGHERRFSDLVLKLWGLPGTLVNLRGARQAENADVYEVFVHRESGGRPFVDHAKKTVHLFGQPTDRVTAHEIGHVLGFPDTYYSSWDAKSCRYQMEWNPEDLMSATSGSVDTSHWHEMLAHYQ